MDILFYSPLVFLGISVALQLFQHARFFLPFAFSKSPTKTEAKPPVSVIICARNEAENLKNNLPSFLEQDYPNFEVVVVDHDSTDDTPWILEDFAKKYPNLKLTGVKDNVHFTAGKKYAQTIGIKAATNEHLLFTDADCEVRSKDWISLMMEGYTEGTEIVLGYSPYKKGFGYIGWLARYETFLTGIQYLSWAQAKLPYMGVGRNLSYKKELFFDNRGFASHLHLPSGDDDLFVNETANAKNVNLVLAQDSFIDSYPKETLGAWFRQKRRHLNTASLYKPRHKWSLAGQSIGMNFFWMGLLLSIISINFTLPVLILLAIRTLLVYVSYIKTAKKLGELDLAICWPILEAQILVFDLIVFLANKVSRPKEW